MSKYEDEWGKVSMLCNACGEETTDNECYDDGEVAHFDDCDCDECGAESETP